MLEEQLIHDWQCLYLLGCHSWVRQAATATAIMCQIMQLLKWPPKDVSKGESMEPLMLLFWAQAKSFELYSCTLFLSSSYTSRLCPCLYMFLLKHPCRLLDIHGFTPVNPTLLTWSWRLHMRWWQNDHTAHYIFKTPLDLRAQSLL